MARIYRIRSGKNLYMRLRGYSGGREFAYTVDLSKHTAKQWIKAHQSIIQALAPEQRKKASNQQIKEMAWAWLCSPKDARLAAAASGVKLPAHNSAESGIASVLESYLEKFCRAGINSPAAIAKARRQCATVMEFLRLRGISEYSELETGELAKYPEWRASFRKDGRLRETSADTINKEIDRLKAVIKHGVKYCGWQERYLLDGVRARATPRNTKAVRPFEIGEAKSILGWLRAFSAKIGDWHLHDMILLALCAGLEAKALNLLAKDWFKMDLGILRVYDKLVSGVIDAKTQNRARDIPLTPTLRKICERGHVFIRAARTRRKSKMGGTAFAAWAESLLRRAERETGIAEINVHRFRHTCATMRLSAGWQLVRVSRMLGHGSVNTTAKHYARYDLGASAEGFDGMVKVYAEFVKWIDEEYFG